MHAPTIVNRRTGHDSLTAYLVFCAPEERGEGNDGARYYRRQLATSYSMPATVPLKWGSTNVSHNKTRMGCVGQSTIGKVHADLSTHNLGQWIEASQSLMVNRPALKKTVYKHNTEALAVIIRRNCSHAIKHVLFTTTC